jgi:hypothetical protein
MLLVETERTNVKNKCSLVTTLDIHIEVLDAVNFFVNFLRIRDLETIPSLLRLVKHERVRLGTALRPTSLVAEPSAVKSPQNDVHCGSLGKPVRRSKGVRCCLLLHRAACKGSQLHHAKG